MEGQVETTVRAAVRDCDRHLNMIRDHRTKRRRRGRRRMVRSRETRETVMRGENLASAVQVERARQRVRGRTGELFLWNTGIGVVMGQAQDDPVPRHKKRGSHHQQDLCRDPHPPMMIGGIDDVKPMGRERLRAAGQTRTTTPDPCSNGEPPCGAAVSAALRRRRWN